MDENTYFNSNSVEELYSVYVHRLLDSTSLYIKKDPILSLSLTENLRIVSGEVLNGSIQAFPFLDIFTGFKGRIKYARIFMNHEI